MTLKRFVVEITMVVDSDGTEETFLFSTSPFATSPTDVPANTPVYGYLDNAGTFKQELFSGARITGAITPSFGGITLSNHAPDEDGAGVLDHWIDYGVSGGRVTVRWGAEGAAYPSEYSTVYIGYARTPRIGTDKVVLPLSDGMWMLDAPVVTEGFDGSGGLEGFGSVPKPKQFVSNDPGFIVPVLIDSIKQIYFVQSTGTYAHDSWQVTPDQEVNPFDVFELGQKIDRVATNYSSAAEIVSTEPDPGTVRYYFGADSTYLSGWKTGPVYFRLGTPPIGELRVYPIGSPTDEDHARYNGTIASLTFAHMALRAGVSLDRISSAYTAVGAVLVDDDTTYRDLLSKCCRATLGWFGFTRLDVFRSGYLLDPNDEGFSYGVSSEVLPSNPLQPTTSLYTFTQDRYETLKREPVGGMEAPVWSLFVKARKTWPCPVSEAAPDALKDYLTRDPWWATFQGVSDTCKIANPGAIVETLEIENADFPNALTRRLLLERYFALFGGRRDFFILRAPLSDDLLELDIHDVVTLQTPRFGLSAGRKFRIISIDIDCRSDVPSITFGLWGGGLGEFTGTVSLVSNVGSSQTPQIQAGHQTIPNFSQLFYGHASSASGANGQASQTIPAFTHLFYGTSVTMLWEEYDRLQASNAGASDNFGTAVAINNDGTYLVATAPNEDSTATNAGSAYAFLRSGGVWAEQQQFQASDAAASDQYGGSNLLGTSGYGVHYIAISDDGDRAIVSMPNDDSVVGAAYIVKRTGTSWAEEQKLVGSDSVAGDYFGYAVAMNGAGDVVAVSAPRDQNSLGVQAGSVYVFTRSGTTWTEQTRIQLTTGGGAVQAIGVSLALNQAGDTLAIGCGGGVSLKAVIFTESGGTWTQQQSLSAPTAGAFGCSVALDTAGDTLVVGAPDQTTSDGTGRGAAHIYTRSGGTWTYQKELTDESGANNDDYGFSVAISGDAATVLVGAPFNDDIGGNAGAVFVYRGYGLWNFDTQLSGADTAAADSFGNSVAISRDGLWAVVGAYFDTNSDGSSAGSAYVFQLTS